LVTTGNRDLHPWVSLKDLLERDPHIDRYGLRVALILVPGDQLTAAGTSLSQAHFAKQGKDSA